MPGRVGGNVPDTGYSWVILLACALLNTLISACFASLSIFFPEYISHFRISRAKAAVVASLAMGVSGLIGVVLGPLAKRFGCRRMILLGCLVVSAGTVVSSVVDNIYGLYITHGLLSGLGIGCYTIGGTVSILEYFDKKRSFAFGLFAAGYSVGSFIGPQIARILIDQYTWKGALLIFGGIHLHGLVFGGLIRPFRTAREVSDNPEHKTSHEELQLSSKDATNEEIKSKSGYKLTDFFDYTLLTDVKLVLFYVGTTLMITGFICPYMFLPVRAMSYGISPTRSAILVSILAASSGVCRPLFGWLGDLIRKWRTLMVAVAAACYGALIAASWLIRDFTGLAVVIGVTGCIGAAFISNNNAVMGDITPPQKIPHATGLLMVTFGTANLVSQPLGGYLIDITGDYAMPFLVFGIAMVIGSVLSFILYGLQYRQRGKQKSQESSHNDNLLNIQATIQTKGETEKSESQDN